MKIEPTYITFEQAKWLKEKGFDTKIQAAFINNKLVEFNIKTNFRSLLENLDTGTDIIVAPEQWQVVEWLRVNHGIWVSVGVGSLFHGDKFFILIKKYNIDRWELTPLDNESHSPYDTPQEAYSAAFDYILTSNLI